ncbi:uncharacterized protein LOC116275795 [Papio anubis]|uniref:uncharacterized protein LOC116275795 n=1 Tax=Papio anubis TaxID=9555 RepID=UPI00083F3019|nr:uncharacterized protein LOC116275795 [Papio anubis]XP_031524387.1 uncharacterized protein LOC116275795 [Papio anubis]XP_031524388.1 uncharacterized protein LOC116275795 [Papio anubis]XP_031524389.1 uncharacterized protein LOC116275795 [Papio anubis]XP_031524390.1 uncharacterized protein LOC116275795 [Papio anubis]XP_031524391.1 uncharacterized protein LOC116275795 [Papio anubis]XP_031524392.1 uncharacterized protein LOC116275795 [Papio anubis]XP_031524393.1 uncharacterized protein LOC1162
MGRCLSFSLLPLHPEELTPQLTSRCGSGLPWSCHVTLTVSQGKRVGGCSNYSLETVNEPRGSQGSSHLLCVHFLIETLGAEAYLTWLLGQWGADKEQTHPLRSAGWIPVVLHTIQITKASGRSHTFLTSFSWFYQVLNQLNLKGQPVTVPHRQTKPCWTTGEVSRTSLTAKPRRRSVGASLDEVVMGGCQTRIQISHERNRSQARGGNKASSPPLQGLGSAGVEAEAVLQSHCKSTGSSLVGDTVQAFQPLCVWVFFFFCRWGDGISQLPLASGCEMRLGEDGTICIPGRASASGGMGWRGHGGVHV